MKLDRLAFAALLCLAPACGFPDDVDDDDQTTGTLHLEWAVNGGTTGADCDAAGAQYIQIDMRRLQRNSFFEYTTNCNRMSDSLQITPDEYEGEATLQGPDRALTRQLPLGTFLVVDGKLTSLSIDFTSDSFL